LRDQAQKHNVYTSPHSSGSYSTYPIVNFGRTDLALIWTTGIYLRSFSWFRSTGSWSVKSVCLKRYGVTSLIMTSLWVTSRYLKA